jgi:hypothetical protein
MNLEEFIPGVKYHGVNTAKNVAVSGTTTLSGANTLSGATTISGAATLSGATTISGQPVLGTTAKKVALYGTTSTTIDAQNGTPTIAQLLGGIILHNSKTGAGTLTTPTGAEISAGITGVAVGYTFDCLYVNYGNQTVTITAGASGVTVTGTAAITTAKNALMRFVNTAANTWVVYPVFG